MFKKLRYIFAHNSDRMPKMSSCPKILATVTRHSPKFRGGAAGDETNKYYEKHGRRCGRGIAPKIYDLHPSLIDYTCEVYNIIAIYNKH